MSSRCENAQSHSGLRTTNFAVCNIPVLMANPRTCFIFAVRIPMAAQPRGERAGPGCAAYHGHATVSSSISVDWPPPVEGQVAM